LLIYDSKLEVMEIYIFLDDRMRSYDEIYIPESQRLLDLCLTFCC
jgi:hypothetical protein